LAPLRVERQKLSGEELKAKVLEAMDGCLKELLGETCARAICHYLWIRTGLRLEDVVERPEAFVAFLREMFRAGAQIIERKIAEKLCAELEVNPKEVEGADLVSLIKALSFEK